MHFLLPSYDFNNQKTEQLLKSNQIQSDSWGFTGCKMIRRIIATAHVADFESIADATVSSGCETRCMAAAIWLIMQASSNRMSTRQVVEYLSSIN